MSGSTSPTAAYVDATGIHAPPYETILTYLQDQVWAIFGTDVVVSSDSQDGQMFGIFAQAIYDTNSMAVAVYNSFSPATAVGVGLSSQVKINGLRRLAPTNSTVNLTIGGQVGLQINGGVARDANGTQWILPSPSAIGPSGASVVTATAAIPGAVTAPAGTITTIATPILGWQSVTNTLAAVPGASLESDVALRLRQTNSTMLPSQTLLDGMTGALLDLSGVTRVRAYENDTGVADSNGIPAHSIAFVVEGGDALQIAQAIAARKAPGSGTFGSIVEPITDAHGVRHNIKFSAPTPVPITVLVHLTALQGYTSAVGAEMVSAIAAYISNIEIGGSVYLTHVIWAALSIQGADNKTFDLTSLSMARGGANPAPANVAISFAEAALASSSTISIAIP